MSSFGIYCMGRKRKDMGIRMANEMVHYKPKPIKSYYIAYFDILGYREFFLNNPDKIPDFLQMIHASIQGTISLGNGQ